MVRLFNATPRDEQGRLQLEPWLALLENAFSSEECAHLRQVLTYLASLEASALFQRGLEIALILSEISVESEVLVVACVLPFCVSGKDSLKHFESKLLPKELHLLREVLKLKASSLWQRADKSLEESQQIESLRKMFLIMINDVQVILIKLAESLECLRRSKSLTPDQRQRLAQEAMDMDAPLANRLGLWQLKWEIEDRAFVILNPDAYFAITQALQEKRLDRELYLKAFVSQLEEDFHQLGIQADISGRVKHVYSIWRKMQQKHLDFNCLFDVRAVRILVSDVDACYRVLSRVHQQFKFLPTEFTDYIALPKANGYRSIHTVILGDHSEAIEVQIRTHEMHEASEQGLAAHWRYKEGVNRDIQFERRLEWMRSVLEWQDDLREAPHLAELAKQVVSDRVYVFSPKGRVLDLPRGATALDFAYHIHTDIGHRCRGVKIDGTMRPLQTPLLTGQRVEVLLNKECKPSQDWLRPELQYVKTTRAKQKIQVFLRKALFTEPEKADALVKLETKRGAVEIDTGISQDLKSIANRSVLVMQGGVDNLLFRMAGCCHPIVGDEVFGYITRGRGLTVHQSHCPDVLQLAMKFPERVVKVEWGPSESARFTLSLHLNVVGHESIPEISQLLARVGIPMLQVSLQEVPKNRSFHLLLKVLVKDVVQSRQLMSQLSQLETVLEVKRA